MMSVISRCDVRCDALRVVMASVGPFLGLYPGHITRGLKGALRGT